jgi:predicted DNA-binding transcriptional regulator AlpA
VPILQPLLQEQRMPIKKFERVEANGAGRKRISVADAADYTGLSESTLNKLRMTGAGPKFLKLGRRILYDTNALDGWMASRERASTSDNGSAEAA